MENMFINIQKKYYKQIAMHMSLRAINSETNHKNTQLQPGNVQSQIYYYSVSLLLLAPSQPGDTRTIGGVSMFWFVTQGDRPSCPRLLSADPGINAIDVKLVNTGGVTVGGVGS